MSTTQGGAAPIEVWYTRCGGATASTIAIQKGFLQDEFNGGDITLSSLRDSDNPDVRASHFNHSVTSMFREGGNIPPIWARAKGVDTVVLGITWVDEYQALVTRTDSSIRDLADIKGKRLGVPLHPNAIIDFQRGSAFHGFAHALETAGLSRDDVSFVDIEVRNGSGGHNAAVLAALLNNDIDIAFLRQGTGFYQAEKHDADIRELLRITDIADPLKRINNGTPRPITVHRAFLDRHPDIVVRYLSVLLRSAQWAKANPQEAFQAIAAEEGPYADENLIRRAYPKIPSSLTPKLTPDYIRGLEVQKNFLRDWGFLAADFAIGDWIERAPLEEALRIAGTDNQVAAE